MILNVAVPEGMTIILPRAATSSFSNVERHSSFVVVCVDTATLGAQFDLRSVNLSCVRPVHRRRNSAKCRHW